MSSRADRFDPVTKPEHYNSHPSGVEVIEMTRRMPTCEGAALKYVLRRDLKGKPIQDLQKALEYLRHGKENRTPDLNFMDRTLLGLAMTVLVYEPDLNVRRFLRAVFFHRTPNGHLTSKVDYEGAAKAVGQLIERYRASESMGTMAP